MGIHKYNKMKQQIFHEHNRGNTEQGNQVIIWMHTLPLGKYFLITAQDYCFKQM